MSDEETNKQTGQTPPPNDPWQEVGHQFQILGETLASAFRASWHDEQTQRRFQDVQGSLHSMVDEVDRAVEDSMKSPKAQEARAEAQKAAESLRDASEQTVQELRPHFVNALKQLNEEIQKFVNHVEGRSQQPPEPGPSEKNQP